MENDVWRRKIICQIKERLGKGYQVISLPDEEGDVRPISRIGIQKDGERNGIELQLPYYHPEWMGNEASIQDVVNALVRAYRKLRTDLRGNPLDGLEEEMVKERIVYVLAPKSQGDSQGEAVVAEPYFHMTKLLAIHWTSRDQEYGRCISPQDLRHWDMTPEEAFQKAEENTARIYPPILLDLDQWAFGPSVKERESFYSGLESTAKRVRHLEKPVCVLTSSSGVNGATCMLYPGVLKRIAAAFMDDLLLLVRSTREVLIFPMKALYRGEWQIENFVEIWGLGSRNGSTTASQLLCYKLNSDQVCVYEMSELN